MIRGTGGFSSPQEVIQHYGVKGMKWGVRAAASGEVNPALGRNRTTAIKKARASVDSQKAKIKTTSDPVVKKQLKTNLEQDPSYVAARLKTRGEKAVFTALSLAGSVALVALGDEYATEKSVDNINTQLDTTASRSRL